MNEKEKREILKKARIWFRDSVSAKHIENTEKLTDSSKFNINPFLAVYLANYLTGNSTPESIARALVLPRVLGTSITTSFGTHIQRFTNDVLSSYGSTTSGIDIEFEDQIDGRKKFCQLKSGPNTINKDDVETIAGHFSGVINLGRTNNMQIGFNDLIVGVIYGNEKQLSSHYKRITTQYHFPVIIGQDFWERLTGDADFYKDLIQSIGSIAIETDFKDRLESIIKELAQQDEIISIL